MKRALVGDIGGTNARFALWEDNRMHAVQVFATADYTSPEQAIGAYLAAQGLARGELGAVCLAVAGPVDGDEFRFTNNHWRLSREAFCNTLQVERLLLINDFTAMALGMTRLQAGEYRSVCQGAPDPGRPALVIGPGTGLGVGTLLSLGDERWMALPGEGGHVDLPVGNAREAQIHQQIANEIGHVSAETVLSGGGLLRLYQAICALDGQPAPLQSPAAITDAALAGEPVALAVIEQFCRFLGRVAGNNVLTLGARGGVFIVGGIIPRFAELFLASGFAASFADKGCMSGYFKDVPVWLVTAEFSGLLGAGVALQQAG
ncbi:glucokinase [Pseudomonas sp. B21-032]|uniref:glucokinase n=1 Tax=unclassified Pseudomonas TaxID=196821 RepID=UPI000886CECA|nr:MULTISPECIES: glucokinase [unclassified Pseudomonas]QVM95783.1 glucokinase [Pseudomonas sp. SORT22]UVL57361.1 glucokinase [Pseudomonas sp. B21-035]UVL62662.1 glucokinase [Pseudomonas sp. B21-032]SDQ98259.1 glucokinase [Pseudomonas sp. UC 17F4]